MIQYLKVLEKSITLLVFHKETSNDEIMLHSSNKPDIFFTFDVSKLETFKTLTELQSWNILDISITLLVLNNVTFIIVKE